MRFALPRLEAAFWYGCAVLILLSAALYNGFPLVTSDTGAYINSGFHWEVPTDRPITYGLFVRLSSLGFSLWLVVLAQCLLLAAVLLRCVRVLVPGVASPALRTGLVLLSAWATGLAWFSGQLMPDIFTALGLLTLLLLLFDTGLTGLGRGGALLLLLLCALMHSSNLLTYSLVVLAVLDVAALARLPQRGLLSRRALRQVAAVVFSSWLLLPALHWSFGGGFTISRSSYMFVMGRLLESGVLDAFLNDHCGTGTSYDLCQYRYQLPNDAITFLWDGQSVPNRTGGWEAHRAEYQQVIRAILTSPRYYPALASEAVQATLRQLVSVDHGDGLTAYRDNTNPFWKVQEYFPFELREYLSSYQNQSRLNFTDLSARNQFTLLLTLAGLLLLLGTPVREALAPRARLWLLVCIVGVVANAGVTGGLANVISRLQTRVVWVLPFSVLCLGVAGYPTIVSYFRARLGAGPK